MEINIPDFSSIQPVFIGHLLRDRVPCCAVGVHGELATSSSVSVGFTIYQKKGRECVSTQISVSSHSDQVYKGKDRLLPGRISI